MSIFIALNLCSLWIRVIFVTEEITNKILDFPVIEQCYKISKAFFNIYLDFHKKNV